MTPDADCERVRLQLMAAFDGEAVTAADEAPDREQHVAACASCRQWVQDLESMDRRFQGMPYPGGPVDLWGAVEGKLGLSGTRPSATDRLWLIGALVLGWRALQLLIDLPLPMLHPLVPLAGAIAALWLLARDPLAIETFAPELEKRGV